MIRTEAIMTSETSHWNGGRGYMVQYLRKKVGLMEQFGTGM